MSEAVALDPLERRIIDGLQGGFPVCSRPYAVAAQRLGMQENELIARIERLLQRGVLTRFGPMFQVERVGGSFVLAALEVPESDWERVLAAVNALPQVAHNYRREHRFNMWFVLATETQAGIAEAIAHIEADTGLTVHAFPKEKEYFVEMKLATRGAAHG